MLKITHQKVNFEINEKDQNQPYSISTIEKIKDEEVSIIISLYVIDKIEKEKNLDTGYEIIEIFNQNITKIELKNVDSLYYSSNVILNSKTKNETIIFNNIALRDSRKKTNIGCYNLRICCKNKTSAYIIKNLIENKIQSINLYCHS